MLNCAEMTSPRLRQKSQSTARRVWIASPPQPQPMPLPQRCVQRPVGICSAPHGSVNSVNPRYALDITRRCCGRSCEWMNRRRCWQPVSLVMVISGSHELLEVMLRIPKLYGWEMLRAIADLLGTLNLYSLWEVLSPKPVKTGMEKVLPAPGLMWTSQMMCGVGVFLIAAFASNSLISLKCFVDLGGLVWRPKPSWSTRTCHQLRCSRSTKAQKWLLSG